MTHASINDVLSRCAKPGCDSSIYPAIQNVFLACRGLGTVITTNHMLYENEVKAVLNTPTTSPPSR